MFTDVKIVIFAIACGLGYWSHFVVKFPQDYHLLIIAVLSYASLMGFNWLLENKLER